MTNYGLIALDDKLNVIKFQYLAETSGVFDFIDPENILLSQNYYFGYKIPIKNLNEFKKIHPNSGYDYSLVNFLRMDSKVQIICPKHGIFEQRPSEHKRKAGCPICSKEYQKINPNGLKTQEETIEQFQKVHQDKYNYSLVKYINTNTKVKIICPKHGKFEQLPLNHKNGDGCPKCSHTTPLSKGELIERFNFVHKNKYDY